MNTLLFLLKYDYNQVTLDSITKVNSINRITTSAVSACCYCFCEHPAIVVPVYSEICTYCNSL